LTTEADFPARAEAPVQKAIHAIVENYATHKHPRCRVDLSARMAAVINRITGGISAPVFLIPRESWNIVRYSITARTRDLTGKEDILLDRFRLVRFRGCLPVQNLRRTTLHRWLASEHAQHEHGHETAEKSRQ
jgi:hypothetical protein